MASKWIKIPDEMARKHPLYGRGGWLVVFAIVVSSGFLKQVAELRVAAFESGLSEFAFLALDHPVVIHLRLLLVINFIFVAIILWALISRNVKFRTISSVAIVFIYPVMFLVALAIPNATGMVKMLAAGVIPWLVSGIIWISYLQRSRRVRVTFDGSVRSDDPFLLSDSERDVASESTDSPIVDMTHLNQPENRSVEPKPVEGIVSKPSLDGEIKSLIGDKTTPFCVTNEALVISRHIVGAILLLVGLKYFLGIGFDENSIEFSVIIWSVVKYLVVAFVLFFLVFLYFTEKTKTRKVGTLIAITWLSLIAVSVHEIIKNDSKTYSTNSRKSSSNTSFSTLLEREAAQKAIWHKLERWLNNVNSDGEKLVDFDVDGALKAGYSKSLIAQFLLTKVGVDYEEIIRRGYSDDEIIDKLIKPQLSQESDRFINFDDAKSSKKNHCLLQISETS